MRLLDPALLAALNHVLSGLPWATQRLQKFSGQTARISVGDFSLCLTVAADGTFVQPAVDAHATVAISVPAEPLPELLRARGQGNGIPTGIRLEGDVEFAEGLGFVLRNLHWDVEEDLSKVLGDVVAHRLTETGKSIITAHGQALLAARDNLLEYLTEEEGVLITRSEADEGTLSFRALRDDLDRCEKRIERLEKRRRTHSAG